MKSFDTLGFIMAYEDGQGEQAIDEGFQQLINSGLVWSLQGHYVRMAQRLIEAGYCTLPTSRKTDEIPLTD